MQLTRRNHMCAAKRVISMLTRSMLCVHGFAESRGRGGAVGRDATADISVDSLHSPLAPSSSVSPTTAEPRLSCLWRWHHRYSAKSTRPDNTGRKPSVSPCFACPTPVLRFCAFSLHLLCLCQCLPLATLHCSLTSLAYSER